MASCEKCGREIKNFGIFLGGIRCANYCNTFPRPIQGLTTMLTRSLTAQEDGSITYTDADDITVVEPITTPIQTAGGWSRDEPDHELAALMAAAPDLLEALRETLGFIQSLLNTNADEAVDFLTNNGEQVESVARQAIARATNPDYITNSIGQTRDADTNHDWQTHYTDPALDAILDAK